MIISANKTEIAIVGLSDENSVFLPMAVRNTMDIWFLSDEINPAIMIFKALVEMRASGLHILGMASEKDFMLHGILLQTEHFPCFEEDQSRRSVTLWGFGDTKNQTIDNGLIDGIRARTRMSVFVSKNIPETGKYHRVFAADSASKSENTCARKNQTTQ